MKRVGTLVCVLACVCLAAVDEWNEKTGFADWAHPVSCRVTYDGGRMQMDVTGNDCSVLNVNIDLDPKEYDGIEFEYKASGDIKPNPGQVYFAGADGKIQGNQYWILNRLKPDGKWHRSVTKQVASGLEKWTEQSRITKLRFDPFQFGTGTVEIRAIRLLKKKDFIVPADEDIGYGSSQHPHLWTLGRKNKNPFIVGKGNRFDHRYRFLARLPLDRLQAKGEVKEAELEFQLSLFVGTKASRVYLIEAIDEDIQKLKANDLNAASVSLLGKVELSGENVSLPVKVEITDAVNVALANVWSGVTIRIRPEEEKNDDPGASGAAINPNSIKLYFK